MRRWFRIIHKRQILADMSHGVDVNKVPVVYGHPRQDVTLVMRQIDGVHCADRWHARTPASRPWPHGRDIIAAFYSMSWIKRPEVWSIQS